MTSALLVCFCAWSLAGLDATHVFCSAIPYHIIASFCPFKIGFHSPLSHSLPTIRLLSMRLIAASLALTTCSHAHPVRSCRAHESQVTSRVRRVIGPRNLDAPPASSDCPYLERNQVALNTPIYQPRNAYRWCRGNAR